MLFVRSRAQKPSFVTTVAYGEVLRALRTGTTVGESVERGQFRMLICISRKANHGRLRKQHVFGLECQTGADSKPFPHPGH